MRRTATQLRDHIIDAARTEFAHYGLAGSRIDRIAQAAHASKERLYAHFGDKEKLFRDVIATDVSSFYRSVTLRPDAVPEFAGDIYDLGRNSPEHLRMITWARLEGLALDQPPADPHPDAQAIFDDAIAAIETAQRDGYVDHHWQPMDLLALLFGIGLAWAHAPEPHHTLTDATVITRQRAAAVEAARRVVSPTCG